MSSSGITVKTLFGYSFPDGFKCENYHLIIENFSTNFLQYPQFQVNLEQEIQIAIHLSKTL